MGEQFKVSLINMAHTALTHRMKLSPPEATPPVWCGICLCAEVKEEKKKMATRDLWGKNNISNNWVGQFLVVAEQVGQKASERATLKEAGGDRARVLMSDLQTQVQACSAAEQLWVLSHWLLHSVPQFLHLWNGGYKSTYHPWLFESKVRHANFLHSACHTIGPYSIITG